MKAVFSQMAEATGIRDDEVRRRTFDMYLDDAGSYHLLTAEEEREQARRIAELGHSYWRSLLSCPSTMEAMIAAARGLIRHNDFPTEVADAALRSLAAFRSVRDRASAERLAKAVDDLALRLTSLDVDRECADRLCDELTAQVDGCGNILSGHLSRDPDSAVLRAHLKRVRMARRALQSARNRFICANLRLVVKVAQRYGRNRMPLADRVQEGNLGLMKAVDRFDPDRGVRFSTYAAWWIRHAVTRALVNRGRTVRIPAHLHTVFTKVRGVRKHLRGQLGRDPTLAEVAETIDVPLDKVEAAMSAMELVSVGLDAPVADRDSPTIADGLEDPHPPDWGDQLDARRNAVIVQQALEDLEPMEADILAHRFGLNGNKRMTLQKLGAKYSLSRERIRQLQNRALKKLRAAVDDSPIPTLAVA